MEEVLQCILKQFKKAEYKIHVLHTSMQGLEFLQYHIFLDSIYNYLADQIDPLMETLEQLWYDVPMNLSEIIKKEWEEEDDVIELTSQTPNIKDQLQLVENTLITLRDELQEGIMTSWSLNDYVVQNDLIDYQKQIRIFEWKNRRIMWKK
jgi:DNA-binding ferritin-like protein